MPSLREFFDSVSADRLMDRARHPAAIREFLRQERRMLDRLAEPVELLIEVGCMDGRNLEWAIAQRTLYLGVDIAPRHVESGRAAILRRGLSPDRYRFACGEAESLDTLIEPDLLARANGRGLIFFPFNILGAVPDLARVFASVRRSGLPVLISGYQTTDDATACRGEYYRWCGYRHLSVRREQRGVSFRTAEGFQTTAYEPAYLQALAHAHDLPLTAYVWSRLNVLYAPDWLLTRAGLPGRPRPARAASATAPPPPFDSRASL